MGALEKFLDYVKYDTMSVSDVEEFPSTDNQKKLLNHLASELRAMGISDVRQAKEGYVYATIPSNCLDRTIPSIGFISHVDTSEAVSGKNVKPRIINNYDGNDIELSEKYVTQVSDFPELKKYKGKRLVVTDGSTLLGADDKAGVAAIMEMAEYVMRHSDYKHGNICIGFTPDEEVGRGVEYFDVCGFGANYAYTVDGEFLGEISYENFNAADAKVTFEGRSVFPGDGKDRMINAIHLFEEFDSMLPDEKPVNTEKREGFYHIYDAKGDVSSFEARYIIRDHNFQSFENRKSVMEKCVNALNAKYNRNLAKCEIEDSYYNMGEKMIEHMEVVEIAKKAIKDIGIEPVVVPIRGGTDGARLSFMGLPCPNLGTGGGLFHSRHEFLCVDDLEKNVELLLQIVRLYEQSN